MTDPLIQCLALLASTFPHPAMDDTRLRAYRMVLSDMSAEECDRAFRSLMLERERRFFPSPGEILEAGRPSPTSADVAELYDTIEAEVLFRRAKLADIEAKFSPAAVKAIRAAGGLEEVRRFHDGRVFTLRRFTEAYLECPATERVALPAATNRAAQLTVETARVLSFPRSGTR
jgi:hypothetical protein